MHLVPQKHFYGKLFPAFRPACAAAFLISAFSIFAQAVPEDADLYYRRTHQGQFPPPGVDTSDHSSELTNTLAAPPTTTSTNLVIESNTILDNGVNATNLGKGDWIWQMSTTESHLGLAAGNVQGVINYETNMHMQWITVKCGDGGNIYPSAGSPQFTADLVNRAHAAGLKIFGWAYAYGANVAGEIFIATNCLGLGADGFIIDAESEYEVLASNAAAATAYCQGIRAAYPTRFLAHAPFPYISSHAGFPYVAFGIYCDAVMPQDYWGAIGISPQTMVVNMNSKWITWQNSLTGSNTNAIKPIIPIGQSYAPVTGAEITAFMLALQTNSPKACASGYNGVSFWDAQERTADMDAAVLGAVIGTNSQPPSASLSSSLHRVLDSGGSVSFTGVAAGTPPLKFQWLLNSVKISGATNLVISITNTQTTNAGNYALAVTNNFGSVTSSAVSLLVFPPQVSVFADNFDVNTAANWVINKSSTDTLATFAFDYSALGIAPAPNSTNGSTRGLQLKANLVVSNTAALSLSPTNQSFTGDYRLHFDAWINVNGPLPGGIGSTEFLTAGLGTSGTRTEWTGAGSTADGFYFSINGDGGSGDSATGTADVNAYIGTAVQLVATGDYWAGTDATARGNGNVYYTTALPNAAAAPALQQANYPQQSGSLNPGTFGLAWHDVIVSRRGSTVDWVVDGIRFATIFNATFTASNVFVGFWDPFPSLSSNNVINFGLVDNVRVEMPAVAPAFITQPVAQTVKLGTNVTLTASASGLPAPAFQWRFNGTNISGATNAAYALTLVAATNTGNYSVLATNIGGSVTSSNAALALLPPNAAQFQSISVPPSGAVQIGFTGDAFWNYTIESSTNLVNWSALTNLTSTNGVFNFTAGAITNSPQQFFRARVGP